MFSGDGFSDGSDSYLQFRDAHAPCLLKLCIPPSNGIVRWWLFPEFGAELPLDNCTPTIVLNNPVLCLMRRAQSCQFQSVKKYWIFDKLRYWCRYINYQTSATCIKTTKPTFHRISIKTYADVLTGHHSLKHTFDLCVLLFEPYSEVKATLQEMLFCQIGMSEFHTAWHSEFLCFRKFTHRLNEVLNLRYLFVKLIMKLG